MPLLRLSYDAWVLRRLALPSLCLVAAACASGPGLDEKTRPWLLGAPEVLFDGRSLGDWTPVRPGAADVVDGELQLVAGGGITWRGPVLPRDEYELSFELLRPPENTVYAEVVFPVGGNQVALVLGAQRGTISGLSNLEGFDATENETRLELFLQPDRWYRVRIQVTKRQLLIGLEHRILVKLALQGRGLALPPGKEPLVPLGIATQARSLSVRRIELRRPPGTGGGETPGGGLSVLPGPIR